MEDLLAILARQSDAAQTDRPPQVTPQHKSPSKYISRRRSVFSLANEWLRAKSGFIHKEIPTETPKKGSKGPLGQFFSLRGSKEKNGKRGEPMITRTQSCSPQKKEVIVIDEYCTMRARRRKSLQDLLGTVTGKISRRHRDMMAENSRKSYESTRENIKSGHGIPSFESASIIDAEDVQQSLTNLSSKSRTELPSAIGVQCRCCSLIEKQVALKHKAGQHPVPVTPPRNKTTSPTFAIPKQQFDDNVQENGKDKRTTEQPWAPDLCNGTASCPDPGQNNHIPASQSPNRQYSISTSVAMMNLDLETPDYKQIRSEDDTPTHYECNIDNATTTENVVDIDPLFGSRARDREARYQLISSEGHRPCTGQTNNEIEDQAELTAVKLSTHPDILTVQSIWSSDSLDGPEIEIDDEYICSWDGNESEVWAPAVASQEIMKNGKMAPYRHVKSSGGVTPGFPNFEDRYRSAHQEENKVRRDSHTTLPELLRYTTRSYENPSVPANVEREESRNLPVAMTSYTQSFDVDSSSQAFALTRDTSFSDWQAPDFTIKSCTTSRCKELELDSFTYPAPLNSVVPKTRARYSSRPGALQEKVAYGRNGLGPFMNSQQSPIGPVDVGFPRSEFLPAYTETYFPQNEVIGGLYHNYNYSDNYLFDRSSHSIIPQGNFGSHLPTDSQELEWFWLPVRTFSNYCAPEGNQNAKMFSNSGFRKTSPSEEFLANSLSNCTRARECNQNVSLSDIDGFSDDPKDLLPSEYSSTTEPDPNGSGCPDAKLTVRNISNTTSEENSRFNCIGIDNQCSITADDETGRRYIGSLFSSSNESILMDKNARRPASNSAESVWSKIEDSRSEQAGRVKTWAELGKDFLDIYAPFNGINPEQRAQLAVHNAISIRGGGQNNFMDETESVSSLSTEKNCTLSEIDFQTGFRDENCESATTFRQVEDIAGGESQGFSLQATKNLCATDTIAEDLEKVVVGDKLSEQKFDTNDEKTITPSLCIKERDSVPDIQLIEPRSSDDIKMSLHNGHSGLTFSEGCQAERDQFCCKTTTGLTASSEALYLHEQSEDAKQEDLNENNPYVGAELIDSLSGPPRRGLTKTVHLLMGGKKNEKNKRHKISTVADSIVTVNEDAGLHLRIKQKLKRSPISAIEAADGAASLPPALTNFNWENSARIAITDSDFGVAQVSMLNVRNSSPTKNFCPDSPETCYTTRVSDADTEESEAFGEKLHRYGRSREDENEDWRDFVLYG